MTKYLDEVTAATYLRLGKTIEIFLGRSFEDNEILNFIEINNDNRDAVSVTLLQVFDEGSLEYLDLYSFSYVDPDMDFETYTFPDFSSAKKYIKEKFELQEFTFLPQGGSQAEYERLLLKERT